MEVEVIGVLVKTPRLNAGDVFMFHDEEGKPHIALMTDPSASHKAGKMVELSSPKLPISLVDGPLIINPVFKFTNPIFRPRVSSESSRPPHAQRQIGDVAVTDKGTFIWLAAGKAVNVQDGSYADFVGDAVWFAGWSIEIDQGDQESQKIVEFQGKPPFTYSNV